MRPAPRHVLLLHYNRRHHPAAIAWLRRRFGARVTSLVVDLGEVSAGEALLREARAAGSEHALLFDGRDVFCEEFVSRAIKANATYQHKYVLSAALARPMLARTLVAVARRIGADAIAHGFRGNDQIRLDMGIAALSELPSIAFLRAWDVDEPEVTRIAAALGVPDEPGTGNPFSVSENLWGKSTECGPLADPAAPPPDSIFSYVSPIDETPATPADIAIEFERGVPVALDGARAPLAQIVARLNELGARHGVGVVDMVEDGMVGIKSRAIYESPAAWCLIEAHRDLERFVCTRHENRVKPLVDAEWAQQLYCGLWFEPLTAHLGAFIDSMNACVSGRVQLRLHRGAIIVRGRESARSIYRADESIFNFGDQFGADDAAAFGRVHNLHTRAAARRGEANEHRSAADVQTDLLRRGLHDQSVDEAG